MVQPNELIEDGQEEVFSKTAVERGINADPPAMPIEDIRAHELIGALSILAGQIDISEYLKSKGSPPAGNLAFVKAQDMVDHFGVNHADICQALENWGDDLIAAANGLASGGWSGNKPAP